MGLGTTRAEINAAKAAVAAQAKTKADIYNIGAAMSLGDPYMLGEEGWGYQWGSPYTVRLDDTDCSGLTGYALFRLVDEIGRQIGLGSTLWKDGTTWKRKAVRYYVSGDLVKVTSGYQTGDQVIFGSNPPYHMAGLTWKVNGVFHTVEARRGVEENTLPELLGRAGCQGVFRFPWVDWGIPVPEPIERVLVVGMTGEDVLQARTRLAAHLGTGYMDVDDYFHEWTGECVKIFQWLRGLTVDGEIGPLTWAELDKIPTFPYLAYGVNSKYAGLAVRHLKRFGFAKLFSDWRTSVSWLLAQEFKKWRESVGLSPEAHLGSEESWPRLLI